MSDYNRERGKLIPLCKKGEVEQTVLNILKKEYPVEWKEYKEKWSWFSPYEALEDIEWRISNQSTYIEIDDILYKNVGYERCHKVEFCNINKHQDGTIDYDACYWNGGTCLSDVLSDAIK